MMNGKLKWFLAASLVVNIFLAGAIAGGAWRWWSAQEQAAGGPVAQARGLRFAADGLPDAQRRAFRSGLRDARRDMGPQLQAARDSRHDLARLLAAPEFDRAAVDAALARTRDADIAIRRQVEGRIVEFAANLSQAEREKLVDGLIQRGPLRQPPQPGQPGQPAQGANN